VDLLKDAQETAASLDYVPLPQAVIHKINEQLKGVTVKK